MEPDKLRKVKQQKEAGINGVTFKMIIDAIEIASSKNKEFIRNGFSLQKNPNSFVKKASVWSETLREEAVLIEGSGIIFKDRGTASVFKADKTLAGILKKLQEVGRLRGCGTLKF